MEFVSKERTKKKKIWDKVEKVQERGTDSFVLICWSTVSQNSLALLPQMGNVLILITSCGAPTNVNNTVMVLISGDVKSKFTFGRRGDNVTVDTCPPCTLSEDCDTVGVPPKHCDVLLHPHQCCPLVLQPVVTWRRIVSCTQKS
jgi:hypothetical protein